VPGIDLHTHTFYSDGTFTPRDLMTLARERGLDVVAVTDHDTTVGLAEAEAAAEPLGIELVPGVEFSTVRDGEGMHILAYFVDPSDPGLKEELERLQADRFTRGERMVARLQELGYPISFDRVREIAQGGNIIRPHVAQALVEAGVVPSVKDAFSDELIGSGGKAYVEKHALHPVDALRLIHGAGGELVEAGLDGIEASHPEHTPEMELQYVQMAERWGLIWTGSSDCHGTRYDPVRLGSRTTPPDQFQRLKARAAELGSRARP